MKRIAITSIFALCGAFCVSGCGGGMTADADNAYKPQGTDLTNREGRPHTFVDISSIPIMHYVVKQSDSYSIDPKVEVDGYFYIFKINSPHGEYTARSVRDLIRICHEIEVIENYRNTKQGSAFATGLKQSAAGIGKGAVNLVRHPGQSVKRVGQGVGRLGRFFASPFQKQTPRYASSGDDLALLGSGPGGGERRLLAHELGIDVYSDSPNTQAFLKDIAGKRMLGKMPLSSAVFALPGGAVFTLSLTPMGYDPTTEDLIRDNSPADLKRLLALRFKERLQADYETAGSPVQVFLDNPNFTPRQKAYVYRYLMDMADVAGHDTALEFLGGVFNPEMAKIAMAQLEMLSLLHTRARKLQTFISVRNTIAGMTPDKTLCAIISIDTVRFWPDVEESVKSIVRKAHKIGAKYAEIWSTGDIDAKSIAYANKYGVSVRQNILRHAVFQKTRSDVVPRRVRESNPKPVYDSKKEETPPTSPVVEKVEPKAEVVPPAASEVDPALVPPASSAPKSPAKDAEEALPQLNF